jgi:hypothetical protein
VSQFAPFAPLNQQKPPTIAPQGGGVVVVVVVAGVSVTTESTKVFTADSRAVASPVLTQPPSASALTMASENLVSAVWRHDCSTPALASIAVV